MSDLSTCLKFCEDCSNIWTTESEEGVLNVLQGAETLVHPPSYLAFSDHHLLVNILGFRNELLQLPYPLPHLGFHHLNKTRLIETPLLAR